MIGRSVVNSASNSRSRQAVRMLVLVLEAHEVDDVDEPDPQVGQLLAEEVDRGERLERRDVAAAGDDDVRLAVVVAGPVPDPEAARAVEDRLVHRQVVEGRLLAGDDDVDVVACCAGSGRRPTAACSRRAAGRRG